MCVCVYVCVCVCACAHICVSVYVLYIVHCDVGACGRVLFEDQEMQLVNVTLFQRVVDEFKHKCRENK